MNNVNITATNVEFISTASATVSANLIDPKWEAVDDTTFHVITEQGVYLLWVTENTINGQTYISSVELIEYLNNL
jgi:hypothetical protein